MRFIRHRKHSTVRSGSQRLLLLAVCMELLSSCVGNIDKIDFLNTGNPPDQTIKNAHIQRSSSAKLQLIMDAPVIEKYSKPEAKTLYPKGVKLQFFDASGKPKATLSARYAISYDSKQIMMARDSVVIIDLNSRDTSYLEELTWNSAEHRIYSDKPLRSVNGARVTYGDGLESDENFTNPLILHQRGTIEWKEE